MFGGLNALEYLKKLVYFFPPPTPPTPIASSKSKLWYLKLAVDMSIFIFLKQTDDFNSTEVEFSPHTEMFKDLATVQMFHKWPKPKAAILGRTVCVC